MKEYRKEILAKVQYVFVVLISVSFILAYFGLSQYIGVITGVAIWLITGVITTGITQMIIQAFSGNILEKIPVTIRIGDYEFNLTQFAILTIILKLIIFR